MKTHHNGTVDFVNLKTWDIPAFVFAVFTITFGPGLPITAAQQALAPPTSIGSDVIRAVPADILDDIFSFDADNNTASWLGLDVRNISVSENPESKKAPYQVMLEADLFDADQRVATLTSTNTLDRMAISITTPDAVFDQVVERYGSGGLIVTSALTSPAPGNIGTASSITLTEIVDIDSGEITVQGRASPDEFWESVAASVGFPGLDGGERSILGWLVAGLLIAVVVVGIICYYGSVLNPWGWCW